MKTLIVGYGLIGQASAATCSRDIDVHVLDRHPTDAVFPTQTVDLLDRAATREAVQAVRPDVIVYAAGELGTTVIRDPNGALDRAVTAFKHLLIGMDAARSVRRLVLCSSLSVYDVTASSLPIREEDNAALAPRTPYGRIKLMLERLAFHATPSLGVDCIALRFTGVYAPDPRQGGGWMHRALHEALAPLRQGAAHAELPTVLVGNEYLHIEDAARAVQLAVHDVGPSVACNIGPGFRYDPIALQADVQHHFPGADVTVAATAPPGGSHGLTPHLDTTYARARFAFTATHPTLRTGLTRPEPHSSSGGAIP